ncbi:chorismate synthase [Thermodesulfobacterium sp.]|uniref:chorismate synthase n=1 Tax=Thermodesulfobacterium sp. TaxID=1965289 RepID=UPI002647942B|nr:chorismate synthase [Thermodesulfobacterium sp.]MDN5379141.1 chorismate synthase [Thermodesulfobacterium sp.]
MSGNSFGVLFRVTTFGESHGKALGAVVEGCPPGLTLSEEYIQKEVDKRRSKEFIGQTPRKEKDRVEILSGVFEGYTTGTPIGILVYNTDVKSSAYQQLKEVFRPGHADFTYHMKYGGFRDYRGGGRSSGRETVVRVAAGAVAKRVLEEYGISVVAYTIALGGVVAEKRDLEFIYKNHLYCPDEEAYLKMCQKIEEAVREGDSLGGVVEVLARGVPAGLGEPVFDKLEADLSKGLMSIGAVKGVEVGAGFKAAQLKGSENNDPISSYGFLKNDAGGILGGISSGQDIVLRVAVKPIPSIRKPQKTINLQKEELDLIIEGRHDVSAIPRIVPVVEAMVRIVLADHLLRQLAYLAFQQRLRFPNFWE